MMKFDPGNHIGRKGYVKLASGIYAYGFICETGISGMAGYYALLEFINGKGNQVRVCLSDIRELITKKPKGRILGKEESDG